MVTAKTALAICLLAASIYFLHAGNAPRSVPAEQMGRELTATNALSCHSLAFYNHKLYAAVPAGLLEIESGSVQRLYQWNKDYSQLHGVWNDTANGLLWVCLYDGYKLAYYDGRTWWAVKFPKPLHGYISRDDVLRGFRGVSDSRSFWLEGAGRVWRWSGAKSGKWTEEILPSAFHPEWATGLPLRRVIPTDGNVFFVKRGDQDWDWRLMLLDDPRMTDHPKRAQLEAKIEGDSAWYLASGQWIAITNKEGKFFTEETAAGNGKGYIRTTKGNLLEVTAAGISALKIPGVCEAIAPSATGTLLASFRGLGVFELKEDWHRLLKSPYSDSDWDCEVHLAAQEGYLALAVSRRKIGGAKPSNNSLPGIWFSKGLEWKLVSIHADQ